MANYEDQHASRPMAHMFYFVLADTSSEATERFVNACKQFLGGHPGQIHFSVGTRVLHIRRPVSALNFDVAVNMVFENLAAYERYKHDERHELFITETAGMSTGRIVHDSFIDGEILAGPSNISTPKEDASNA